MHAHHHSTINVSSKGQIVIPKDFRSAIGIGTGSKVIIEYIDKTTLALRPFHSTIQELFGLGKKLKKAKTIKPDDIGQLVLAEDEKTKSGK